MKKAYHIGFLPSIVKKHLLFMYGYGNIHLDIVKAVTGLPCIGLHFRERGMVGSAYVQYRAFSHELPLERKVEGAG